ncbi:MAG: hypothetical protein U1E14_17790 [Geminicoccaceae bacterium]
MVATPMAVRLGSLALGSLLAGVAGEARAGFFDACMPPGNQTITVHQNTVVRNERVLLQDNGFDDCNIAVDDGVTLTFRNVRVSVESEKRIAFDGGESSRLNVLGSQFAACDFDVFGFADVRIETSRLIDPPNSTCDVKELEPTGNLTVRGSLLRTNPGGDTNIELTSEVGRVVIERSLLDAGDDIGIEGFTGTSVRLSVLRAPVSIGIAGAGPTLATGNLLRSGSGEIGISGSPCTARLNLPSVGCTVVSPPE